MKKTLLFCLMSLAVSAQAATLLPPGSRARVATSGNLVIDVHFGGEQA